MNNEKPCTNPIQSNECLKHSQTNCDSRTPIFLYIYDVRFFLVHKNGDPFQKMFGEVVPVKLSPGPRIEIQESDTLGGGGGAVGTSVLRTQTDTDGQERSLLEQKLTILLRVR